MDETHIKIGHALLKDLAQMRREKGTFSLEDVWGVFKQVAASPDTAKADHFMHQEIARLAQCVTTVKQEIINFVPPEQSQAVVTDASQRLDEVIKSSEKASHTILDAVDSIQAAAVNIGDEKEKMIREATTRIYEACNFQDINGQHITKVIKMLGTLEQGINRLNALFPADAHSASPSAVSTPDNASSLLNGPQLAAQAPGQEDIDKLFETINPNP